MKKAPHEEGLGGIMVDVKCFVDKVMRQLSPYLEEGASVHFCLNVGVVPVEGSGVLPIVGGGDHQIAFSVVSNKRTTQDEGYPETATGIKTF